MNLCTAEHHAGHSTSMFCCLKLIILLKCTVSNNYKFYQVLYGARILLYSSSVQSSDLR